MHVLSFTLLSVHADSTHQVVQGQMFQTTVQFHSTQYKWRGRGDLAMASADEDGGDRQKAARKRKLGSYIHQVSIRARICVHIQVCTLCPMSKTDPGALGTFTEAHVSQV